MDFQTLFDNTPTEIQVYILNFLEPVEQAFFGLVCRKWNSLTKLILPNYCLLTEDVLAYAVKIHRKNLIAKIKPLVKNWECAIINAAKYGHLDLLDQAKEWGSPQYVSRRRKNPGSGRRIKYIWSERECDRRYFERALYSAVSAGQIPSVQKILEWTTSNRSWPLIMKKAVKSGKLECVKFVYTSFISDRIIIIDKEQNPRIRSRLQRNTANLRKNVIRFCFSEACREYFPKCMEYARGKFREETPYIVGIKSAASRGQLSSLELIKSWGVSFRKELQFLKVHYPNTNKTLQAHLEGLILCRKKLLKEKKFNREKAGSFYLKRTRDSEGNVIKTQQVRYFTRKRFLQVQEEIKTDISNIEKCKVFLDEWEN